MIERQVWKLAEYRPYIELMSDNDYPLPHFDLVIQGHSPLSAAYGLWEKRNKSLGGAFVEWLRYYGLINWDDPHDISCHLMLNILGQGGDVIQNMEMRGLVERIWIGQFDTLRAKSQVVPYMAGSLIKQGVGHIIFYYQAQRWQDVLNTSKEFSEPTCPICLQPLKVKDQLYWYCTRGHSLGYKEMSTILDWEADGQKEKYAL
jgi:hypothetical protein